MKKKKADDGFELYDLKVVVESDGIRPMICNHPLGSYFFVSGENLILPEGSTFPIYSLAALLPLIPAKQRETHPHDWMTTDMIIACPDPYCGGRFKIERVRKKRFFHSEVTATPLKTKKKSTKRVSL